MKKLVLLSAIVFFLFLNLVVTEVSASSIQKVISIQGILRDSASRPVTTAKAFVFDFYDASTTGTKLQSMTRSITPNADGSFSILTDPLTLTFDQQYWLEVTVAGERISPRFQIATVPYAIYSMNAGSGGASGSTTSSRGKIVIPLNFFSGVATAGPESRYVPYGGYSLQYQNPYDSPGDATHFVLGDKIIPIAKNSLKYRIDFSTLSGVNKIHYRIDYYIYTYQQFSSGLKVKIQLFDYTNGQVIATLVDGTGVDNGIYEGDISFTPPSSGIGTIGLIIGSSSRDQFGASFANIFSLTSASVVLTG